MPARFAREQPHPVLGMTKNGQKIFFGAKFNGLNTDSFGSN
jgi:hypothetical protein